MTPASRVGFAALVAVLCELFTAARADMNGTRLGKDRVSSMAAHARGTKSCAPGRFVGCMLLSQDTPDFGRIGMATTVYRR